MERPGPKSLRPSRRNPSRDHSPKRYANASKSAASNPPHCDRSVIPDGVLRAGRLKRRQPTRSLFRRCSCRFLRWLLVPGSSLTRSCQGVESREPPSVARRSPQAPPIKRDQPLPKPLRGRLVVAPALRESEAVMDAGVEFDLAGGTRAAKQGAQFLDHRQRRQRVVLGAGDVEFTFDLAQ